MVFLSAQKLYGIVSIAEGRQQLLIFTFPLPALNDYKCKLTETHMPNTAVIIFIPLSNFPPWEFTFWGEGGPEESVLSDEGHLW